MSYQKINEGAASPLNRGFGTSYPRFDRISVINAATIHVDIQGKINFKVEGRVITDIIESTTDITKNIQSAYYTPLTFKDLPHGADRNTSPSDTVGDTLTGNIWKRRDNITTFYYDDAFPVSTFRVLKAKFPYTFFNFKDISRTINYTVNGGTSTALTISDPGYAAFDSSFVMYSNTDSFTFDTNVSRINRMNFNPTAVSVVSTTFPNTTTGGRYLDSLSPIKFSYEFTANNNLVLKLLSLGRNVNNPVPAERDLYAITFTRNNGPDIKNLLTYLRSYPIPVIPSNTNTINSDIGLPSTGAASGNLNVKTPISSQISLISVIYSDQGVKTFYPGMDILRPGGGIKKITFNESGKYTLVRLRGQPLEKTFNISMDLNVYSTTYDHIITNTRGVPMPGIDLVFSPHVGFTETLNLSPTFVNDGIGKTYISFAELFADLIWENDEPLKDTQFVVLKKVSLLPNTNDAVYTSSSSGTATILKSLLENFYLVVDSSSSFDYDQYEGGVIACQGVLTPNISYDSFQESISLLGRFAYLPILNIVPDILSFTYDSNDMTISNLSSDGFSIEINENVILIPPISLQRVGNKNVKINISAIFPSELSFQQNEMVTSTLDLPIRLVENVLLDDSMKKFTRPNLDLEINSSGFFKAKVKNGYSESFDVILANSTAKTYLRSTEIQNTSFSLHLTPPAPTIDNNIDKVILTSPIGRITLTLRGSGHLEGNKVSIFSDDIYIGDAFVEENLSWEYSFTCTNTNHQIKAIQSRDESKNRSPPTTASFENGELVSFNIVSPMPTYSLKEISGSSSVEGNVKIKITKNSVVVSESELNVLAGNWVVSLPKEIKKSGSNYYLEATFEYNNGEEQLQELFFEIIPQPPPIISTPTNNAFFSIDTNMDIPIAGTFSVPRATIYLLCTLESNSIYEGESEVDINGQWNHVIPNLDDGKYFIQAYAKPYPNDNENNNSEDETSLSIPTFFEIIMNPDPPVIINSEFDGKTRSLAKNYPITGSGVPWNDIIAEYNGITKITRISDSGEWSFSFDWDINGGDISLKQEHPYKEGIISLPTNFSFEILPDLVTLESFDPFILNLLSGKGDSSSSFDLKFYQVKKDTSLELVLVTSITPSLDGTWKTNFDNSFINPGVYEVNVENLSPIQTRLKSILPSNLAVSIIDNNIQIENIEKESTLSFYINDISTAQSFYPSLPSNASIGNDGTTIFPLEEILPLSRDGVYEISVNQSDVLGNKSPISNSVLKIIGDVLFIISPTKKEAFNPIIDERVFVTGTASPNSHVEITLGNNLLVSTIETTNQGLWETSFSLENIPEGEIRITASYQDQTLNGTLTDFVDISVFIEPPSAPILIGVTADNKVQGEGLSPGDIVVCKNISGEIVGSGVVSTNSPWEIPLFSSSTNRESITAFGVNRIGLVGPQSGVLNYNGDSSPIDPNETLVITTPNGSTKNTKINIKGTGPKKSRIIVESFFDEVKLLSYGQIISDDTGSWEIDVIVGMAGDGNYKFQAHINELYSNSIIITYNKKKDPVPIQRPAAPTVFLPVEKMSSYYFFEGRAIPGATVQIINTKTNATINETTANYSTGIWKIILNSSQASLVHFVQIVNGVLSYPTETILLNDGNEKYMLIALVSFFIFAGAIIFMFILKKKK